MRPLRTTLLIAMLATLSVASAAHATTYNVTRSDDPDLNACATPASGCSLREALIAVNATPSAPDVINLPAANYANTQNAEFAIAHDVAIVGAGSRTTTVNGSAATRVFNVMATTSIVSISGITITGGHVGAGAFGGGIDSEAGASLTLSEVALVGNSAGGGGGINVAPSSVRPLTMTDSLVANNTTTGIFGGAGVLFFTNGPVATLRNVTVTGNAATGISNGGLPTAGGISGVATGTVTIVDSTVSRNSAAGNADAVGNLAGTFTIRDSIVAYGSGPAGRENCLTATRANVSQGYNIEDRDQCFPTRGAGDLVGTDPMLGSLAAIPEATSTLALLPGSPAINAGNPGLCNDAGIHHDQRLLPRPQGRCDVGAFEFQLPILAGAPTITGTPQPGQRLTCNAAAVSSPDGPATTALAWLRDGSPVGTGAGYAVSAADAGHTLVCQLNATNAAGPVSAASAGAAVPAAPVVTPPGAAPKLTLASKTVNVSVTTGKGSLKATCTAPAGQSCVFKGTLYGPGTLPGAKAAAAKRAKKIATLVGTIAAGKRGKLRLKVTTSARKQLKRSHRLKARLRGSVSDKAGKHTSLRTTLTLKAKQETH